MAKLGAVTRIFLRSCTDQPSYSLPPFLCARSDHFFLSFLDIFSFPFVFRLPFRFLPFQVIPLNSSPYFISDAEPSDHRKLNFCPFTLVRPSAPPLFGFPQFFRFFLRCAPPPFRKSPPLVSGFFFLRVAPLLLVPRPPVHFSTALNSLRVRFLAICPVLLLFPPPQFGFLFFCDPGILFFPVSASPFFSRCSLPRTLKPFPNEYFPLSKVFFTLHPLFLALHTTPHF